LVVPTVAVAAAVAVAVAVAVPTELYAIPSPLARPTGAIQASMPTEEEVSTVNTSLLVVPIFGSSPVAATALRGIRQGSYIPPHILCVLRAVVAEQESEEATARVEQSSSLLPSQYPSPLHSITEQP